MRMLANWVTLLICLGIRIAIGLRAIVKRQGRAERSREGQRGAERGREGQRETERYCLCNHAPVRDFVPFEASISQFPERDRNNKMCRRRMYLFFVRNIVS